MASEKEMFIIAIHVDDIVLAIKSDKRIVEAKKALARGFKVKDMGEPHHSLGVKVIQTSKLRSLDWPASVCPKSLEEIWHGGCQAN